MNQSQAPIATATRTLKTLSVATRLLLWLVLAAWALLAVSWATLHLWIVPRIDDWRPELERWATRAVGVPVKVGAIRAESGQGGHVWLPDFLPGLAPSLELTDVRLLDAQGRDALRLPSVRTTLMWVALGLGRAIASNSVPLAWRTAAHGTGTPRKCAMHQAATALPVLRSGRSAVLVQTLSERRNVGRVGVKVGGLCKTPPRHKSRRLASARSSPRL